jgi:hypothetical protein
MNGSERAFILKKEKEKEETLFICIKQATDYAVLYLMSA